LGWVGESLLMAVGGRLASPPGQVEHVEDGAVYTLSLPQITP
jgi:hypothetical protein